MKLLRSTCNFREGQSTHKKGFAQSKNQDGDTTRVYTDFAGANVIQNPKFARFKLHVMILDPYEDM